MVDYARLLGDPVPVELPLGGGDTRETRYVSAFVRSAPIGEIIDMSLEGGVPSAALIAATVVDEDGGPVLSLKAAEAWVENAPVSETFAVVDAIQDAIGFGADVYEVMGWMKDRPLLRSAIRVANATGRHLSTVLAMPIGHLRLLEAAAMLDKMEGVGKGTR